MKITDFNIYIHKESGEVESASAVIDGIQHYTGDIRGGTKMNPQLQAVFSSITVDQYMFESANECVKYGIYQVKSVEIKEIYEDMYIYVEFNQ